MLMFWKQSFKSSADLALQVFDHWRGGALGIVSATQLEWVKKLNQLCELHIFLGLLIYLMW